MKCSKCGCDCETKMLDTIEEQREWLIVLKELVKKYLFLVSKSRAKSNFSVKKWNMLRDELEVEIESRKLL